MSGSSVTRPMTATGRSQRSQIARTASQPRGLDDRDHPLLRLADHHLERLEARLAARDRVEVDEDPGAAAVRGLGDGAGDARRAEVLDADDEPLGDQLEGRLDQQLLRERVADLDARPLGGVAVAEGGRGEHRGAADAVAARRGAVEHDEVAGAVGGGPGEHPAPRAARSPSR